MLKIGFKLWSTNFEVLPQVCDMFSRAAFDYIELYFVPGTLPKVDEFWSRLKIPIVVHAPHSGHGFNLAEKDLKDSNCRIFQDTVRCADKLNSDKIIVHGGNGGPQEEAIRQFKLLGDPRILVENKPKLGLNGKECIGYTPEDISEIVDKCGLKGFTLDFNHAVCAARSLSRDPLEFIGRFIALKPKMFHLSDGDYSSLVDTHMHLGKGNTPLNKFVSFLPQDAVITLETPNEFSKGFSDFVDNKFFLDSLLGADQGG